MQTTFVKRLALTALLSVLGLGTSLAAENPYVGDWELTIPGGNAGWLGVEQKDGNLSASMLWGWGSVEPTAAAKVEDGKLVITRKRTITKKDAAKTKVTLTETITATVEGEVIKLVSVKERENGSGT